MLLAELDLEVQLEGCPILVGIEVGLSCGLLAPIINFVTIIKQYFSHAMKK